MRSQRPLRRLVAAVTIVASASTIAACGISTDDGPRDVDAAQRQDISPAESSEGGAATGTGRIYVLAADSQGTATRMVSVPRDVPDDAKPLLEALLAGPNADERNAGLTTAIPDGTQVRSVRLLSGGILLVDLSEDGSDEPLSELRSVRAIAAVAQIVYTASEVSAVNSVRLTIDGERQSWPGGDGELESEPLTVYDFPGLVDSAQPEYPPVPSA